MSAADRLHTCELVEGPPVECEPLPAGYWLGSAGGELARWKARALAAEGAIAELRAAVGAVT
ncbi:MAG TPA: hypothetical protein VIY73_12715 [Polyangiaceae bacterium]